MTRFWIASISKEHILRGVNGKFIQVCHGKKAPLKRMKKGDYLLVYSSKLTMEGHDKYQAFTAIGRVKDDNISQFQMTENFKPYRRTMEFFECEECAILPLISHLTFIFNKKYWGYPFRLGLFEIPQNDFNLIAERMLKNKEQFLNCI